MCAATLVLKSCENRSWLGPMIYSIAIFKSVFWIMKSKAVVFCPSLVYSLVTFESGNQDFILWPTTFRILECVYKIGNVPMLNDLLF